MDQGPETQPIELLWFNEWEINFFPFLHRNVHRCSKAEAGTTRSVLGNQVSILTPEDTSGMVSSSSTSNVRSRGLRRWRLSRESRPVWYWSDNRRLRRRYHQNRQMDRAPGQ